MQGNPTSHKTWLRWSPLVAALVIVVAILLGGCGGTTIDVGGRPAAPNVGDSCTDNGGSFTYNDGGPGYVEQTAFGLTCQGPVVPAPTSGGICSDPNAPADGNVSGEVSCPTIP